VSRAIALVPTVTLLLGLAAGGGQASAETGATEGRDVASNASLPSVASGARPGPDALYAPSPHAPQLENAPPWIAEPILVSGASAYRAGEYLYQDFLYDDYGAAAVLPLDPTAPPLPRAVLPSSKEAFIFSPRTGDLRYPDDPVFAGNGADLVELRVKPLRDATAFRVTLNTLQAAERTAFTIAIGRSPQPRAWPHGAGVRSPAALFLTVHGEQAELLDAATGVAVSPTSSVSVNLRRRQFEVRVPHAAWDPGTRTVRLAAGVGLWDVTAGRYLAPESPSGASASNAALFNLAFRFDEPMPDWAMLGRSRTIADALAMYQLAETSWWRERAQAEALREGDISQFFAEVDIAKLAAGVDDESGVPDTGPINRIFASRHEFGQGVDYTRLCTAAPPPCEGPFVGQLQPYTLYVPDRPPPARGWGLTLLLHALSTNHNVFLNSKFQSQLGERGTGSLVLTPFGRGPDGWYADYAEADVFEAWADVARHYPVDPGWTAITGYSMGAAGTHRLLARYPDLFARGAMVAGVPRGSELESWRNTPVMVWVGALDEGDHIDRQEESVTQLGQAGLRFAFDQFPTSDHLTIATNDEYGPLAAFLGEHRVDRDPPHVTYIVKPAGDSERARIVADHAYWLSGLRVRDLDSNPTGRIDARSKAFGLGDPQPLGVEASAGLLTGGAHGPTPYRRREQRLGPAPTTPVANALIVDLRNIDTATIDGPRARLRGDKRLRLTVTADGEGVLRLDLRFPGGTKAAGCGLAEVSRGGVVLRFDQGTRTCVLTPPRFRGGRR